ncbi:hypothetical protein H0H87_004071 [Tephrocybe sp. NHM501043]|nr:hypothetical protein H0H87_004071 [Tephrocybe sp. NHM501043]
MLFLSFLHLFLVLSGWAWTTHASQEDDVRDFFATGSDHTNNWAVLRLGIPDSNIILMLADDASCNSRNKFPGSVYADRGRSIELYGDNIEVDYRGYEVTVENFIRVLTGRMDPSVPRSKRLLTDDRSNVFVYMTGHGGNEFLKFQDNEEISAFDIADAFEQMYQKKRYNEIFFMIDTCQANSMYSKFYSPNILATGSSRVGENSYSYENDNDIGVAVIDAYTHYVLEFMEGINKTSHKTMADLFGSYDVGKINSHPGVRSDLFKRPLDQALITDFFGGVSQVEVSPPVSPQPQTHQPQSPPPQTERPTPPQEERHTEAVTESPRSFELRELVAGELIGRKMRAWGSLVVIGALVGWVGTRK